MENSQICSHLKAIREVKTADKAQCEECVLIGGRWLHLRTCQSCGKTLCCDSSPNQHMSHHCRDEQHPVVCSAQPGERWLYCYPDDQVVEY